MISGWYAELKGVTKKGLCMLASKPVGFASAEKRVRVESINQSRLSQ